MPRGGDLGGSPAAGFGGGLAAALMAARQPQNPFAGHTSDPYATDQMGGMGGPDGMGAPPPSIGRALDPNMLALLRQLMQMRAMGGGMDGGFGPGGFPGAQMGSSMGPY